jgi:hypothetical protein
MDRLLENFEGEEKYKTRSAAPAPRATMKAEPADVEQVLVRERNPPVWFPYVAELVARCVAPAPTRICRSRCDRRVRRLGLSTAVTRRLRMTVIYWFERSSWDG